jgi:biotin carboxyl carrier protein
MPSFTIQVNGKRYAISIADADKGIAVTVNTKAFLVKKDVPKPHHIASHAEATHSSEKEHVLVASMAGTIAEVRVKPKRKINKGEVAVILLAMKMHNEIHIPHNAIIREVYVKVGDAVERGAALCLYDVR